MDPTIIRARAHRFVLFTHKEERCNQEIVQEFVPNRLDD